MRENFVIHPKYSHLAAALKDSLQHFAERGEYVTKGERNVIKKVTLEGTVFNIKKFKTPNAFQALVYQFLRKSKAKRSYEYALKLTASGIATPYPVGYLENFSIGLKDSYYISEHLEYDFDFRVLNHNPKFKDRAEILRQFAAFSYKLHEAGVDFLDHSPGNTLIKDNQDGTYQFYLIDLNRMRFGAMNFDQRMHNLRRLWLSKTMINIIAAEYSKLYKKPYLETHSLLSKHSRTFQKKVNSKKLRKRRRL